MRRILEINKMRKNKVKMASNGNRKHLQNSQELDKHSQQVERPLQALYEDHTYARYS